MTDRTSAAVVIRVDDTYTDGSKNTWYVGPFLPHAGSATSAALWRLEDETPPNLSREVRVYTTFLAPGESDLAIGVAS